MMNCCSKDKAMAKPNLMVKLHNTDNVFCHVCPSKLSKRELEDLYFTLVQNNLDLKNNINQLNERMKYQQTKLQRMLATQKTYMGTEGNGKEKAIIEEQKNVIMDLKKENEDLQEKVKDLNMKLCSTKQFLNRGTPKRDPQKKAIPRPKSLSARNSPSTAKNSSTSALNTKADKPAAMGMKSVSCQYLDSVKNSPKTSRNKKVVPSKSGKIEIKPKSCDENKCKTLMEELKQQIANLQEELSKTHDEYATRIARLESEVVDLHTENIKVRYEKNLWEDSVSAHANENSEMKKKLMETQFDCEKLTANLNIEKGKVAELRTQVKAANMTSDALKTIEERLNSDNSPKADGQNTKVNPFIVVDSHDTCAKKSDAVARSPDTLVSSPEYLISPNTAFEGDARGADAVSRYPDNISKGSAASKDLNDPYNVSGRPDTVNGPSDTFNGRRDTSAGNYYPDKVESAGLNTTNPNLNTHVQPQVSNGRRNSRPDAMNLPKGDKCCLNTKCPETLASSLKMRNENIISPDNNSSADSETRHNGQGKTVTGLDTTRSEEAKRRRQTWQDTAKVKNGESSSENENKNGINRRNPSAGLGRSDTRRPSRQAPAKQKKDSSRESDTTSLRDGGIRQYKPNRRESTTPGKAEIRRPSRPIALKNQDKGSSGESGSNRSTVPLDNISSSPTTKSYDTTETKQEKYENNVNDVAQNDNRQDTVPRDKKTESTDDSFCSPDNGPDAKLRGEKFSPGDSNCCQNTVNPRDKIINEIDTPDWQNLPSESTSTSAKIQNNERRNDNTNRPQEKEDLRYDNFTERRSRITDHKNTLEISSSKVFGLKSLAETIPSFNGETKPYLGPTDGVIIEGDEKQEEISPVMSQLVNKSNESSCLCSGQCHCVNSMRTLPGDTTVPAYTPMTAGEVIALSSPQDETLLQKFLSLFQSSPFGTYETDGSPTCCQQPLAETTDPQSAAETSAAKTADDSGFTEANKSAASDVEKGLMKANQDLINKVAELQAQLDMLKVHVLTRRDTYTILKEPSPKPESKFCCDKTAYDQFDNLDPKIDSKHVCLKLDPQKNSDQENFGRCKPHSSDPREAGATCETTCGREGLDCTEECINSKNEEKKLADRLKNESLKSSDPRNDVKRRDDAYRYQIPGPIPVLQERQKPESHLGFDSSVPMDNKFGDVSSIEKEQVNEHYCETKTNEPVRWDEKPKTDSIRPNTNFYEGYSARESPPRDRVLDTKIPMLATPVVLGSIPNPNAPYVRETPMMLNAQDMQRGQNIDILNSKEPTQQIPTPFAEDQPFSSARGSKAVQQYMDNYAQESKYPNVSEHTSTGAQKPQETKIVESTPTKAKNACRTGKKSVKCLCAHYTQYTTNVIHSSSGPKSMVQHSDAETVMNLNSQQTDFKIKSYVATNVDAATAQNFNDARASIIPNSDRSVPVQTNKNKEALGAPSFEEFMDNIGRIEKSGEAPKRKADIAKRIRETTYMDSSDGQNEREAQENKTTFASNTKATRETSVREANKTQQENSLMDDMRTEMTTVYDNRRENYTKEDFTDAGKMQQVHRRETRFEDTRRESRFDETYKERDIVDAGKTRQEKILGDYLQQPGLMPVATSSPTAVTTNRPTANEPLSADNEYKIDKAIDSQFDLCAENVHICTCPIAARKDVTVFRTCSGTLRFRTTSGASTFRRCNCPNPEAKASCGTQINERDGNNITDGKTYTIRAFAEVQKEKEDKTQRALSPENTDQEISSMTDLPSEKDTTTPRPRACQKCPRFSPGEDRTTSKTDSATMPSSSTPEYTAVSVSEGEIPHFAKSKPRHESVYMDPRLEQRQMLDKVSAEKVEQALATIGEELARCRKLLQKPQEVTQLKNLRELNESEMNKANKGESADRTREQLQSPRSSSLALHRADGRPHIGNRPNTPHVMFTLHIGSIVLSDEAVISSRDMALVLTWKFYDQNVAMSHMRPGRVVHFDFSTEYDLKLTDQFLHYLKTEELPIKVCQVNRLDVPLASCTLPLREALLHTNKRADLSLVLVAGPALQRAPAPDVLDTRDEVGVLDLWCMLRAEPRIVPHINKAIAKSRSSLLTAGGNPNVNVPVSPLLMQLDDDQDEVHLSADLENFEPNNNGRLPILDSANQLDRGAHREHTNQMRQERRRMSNYGYVEPHSNDTRRTSTGFIINEVNAPIKTDENMKKVITERSKAYNIQMSAMPQPLLDSYNQTSSRPEGRPSDGQISIAMGASQNTINRYFANKDLDREQSQKKFLDAEPTKERRESDNTAVQGSKFERTRKAIEAFKKVKIQHEEKPYEHDSVDYSEKISRNLPARQPMEQGRSQTLAITILWLALNEECAAMSNPDVQRLYVAYSFLGRSGAELETPMSLPKPKQYQDKCYFNFKKAFQLNEPDMETVGRLAKYRYPSKGPPNPNKCVVFTVVSEPVEDPLGLNNCEDIGTAYLFFGDLLSYSAGSDSYTEVMPIRDTQTDDAACGVLAIRVDGLDVVRRCNTLYG